MKRRYETAPRNGRSVRSGVTVLGGLVVLVAGLLGATGTAHGDDIDVAAQAKNERCAIRLSAALLSQSAAPALMSSADPQSQVDAMIATPAFVDHFASTLNATLSGAPTTGADDPSADAPYFLMKHVLETGKPWSEVFVGLYMVESDGTVKADPNGLGYFRSSSWATKNAGAETAGLRLATAARMLRHVIGLKLVGTTNEPNATEEERSAEGRKRPACSGCHYDSWYALDKLAAVLSRRKGGVNTPVTFFDPPEGYSPQNVLDGTVTNDKDIVTKLVASENFAFNACRTAFHFLFGRDENTCDGALFDRCVDEFKAKKTMQSAVAIIAKDPTFCE